MNCSPIGLRPRFTGLALLGLLTTLVPTTALAQSRAYVANSGAHLVSVIDTASNATLTTIPVGSSPTRIAVAADGRRAYVTNRGSDSVSVIDTAASAVVGTIPIGDAPSACAITPDGSKLYVMIGSGVIQVIDTNSAAIVGAIATTGDGFADIAFTPDGTRAYVASGFIWVIDTATSTIVTSFLPETSANPNVSHSAVALAMSPDGARAYVARVTYDFTGGNFSAGGGVVTVDTATNTVVSGVGTGSLPGSIDITPDGSRLYVGLTATWVNVGTAQGFLPARVVAAIDTAANSVVAWIVVASRPAGVAVTRDGTEAWVTIPTGSTLATIDTASNAITSTLTVAASPGGIDTFVLPEPRITLFCAGDGAGTACPCGNASATGADEGCLNSLGTGGKLRANGIARIGSDTLVLDGSQMPNATALYFQGTLQAGGGLGVIFGDGLRCAGGQVVRLGAKQNVSGASRYPVAGDPSISVQGQVTQPGSVRTYQTWYRNAVAFCTAETSNTSNGVEVRWEM